MSHHTLQKLVARMLFDEEFTTSVYANAEHALKGVDLTSQERDQLLRVDRRAWRHDALRKRRMLRTLAEEFKISTTIILAETRSLASLEAYFSSRFFHSTIQDRGSLARGFAEFLLDGCQRGAWTAPQISDVVRLESVMAVCRRSLAREGKHEVEELPSTISDRSRIRLAPGHDVASFQSNVIPTIQHVEKYLFELSLMPAMALCEDSPKLTGLPEVDGQRKVYFLFHPSATGISMTDLDKTSYLVLYDTKRAVEIRSLLSRHAAKPNATPPQEILSEWLENGALTLVG
ncbi:MAG TPA: hypothetical protein PLK30_08060 [Blastocatellia bacterium]|nr:hypothetical protein [Blastocatellia bacterium]